MLGRRTSLPIHAFALIALASCGQATSVPSNRDSASPPAVAAPSSTLTLAGRVTDAADILTPAQEAGLAAKLERLERTTRRQMVVVTVPSLGGADIATFTRNMANRWGIGRKGEDDGVVVLVAPSERQVRIAVGYGLEKTLTDAQCKQIIDQQMLPSFRQGDLPRGIAAGVDSLIARLG